MSYIFYELPAKMKKDLKRGNLQTVLKLIHMLEKIQIIENSQRTYNLFPGDRSIHHDFLTGEVLPSDEKNIGKTYASIQVYNFDEVNCKGKVTKKCPLF